MNALVSTLEVDTQHCGLFHNKHGSFCRRQPGHAGQHILLSEGNYVLWVKDPLSCQCKHAGMCPGQKCLFSMPIGAPVALAAIADPDWTWDAAE